MKKMDKKEIKKLAFFTSFEDQETKDLKYGDQQKGCKLRSKGTNTYQDSSYSGDWSPETD